MENERLTQAELEAHLTTRWLGRTLELHAQIDSTNTRATHLAREGAPEGTVVLAEHQTAGRGRLGRRWHASPGSALLLSALLRPTWLAPRQAMRLTMIASLAAVAAIAQVSGLEAQVKWPNDLVLRGKKLSGILTELGLQGERLDYAVVGLGLNVNLDVATLPELITPATSLSAELGQPLSRPALLGALLAQWEALYDRLRQGWSPYHAWREHLATLGQPVRVSSADEVVEGVAEDVDEDGALLLRLEDGSIRPILAGDVTLRGYRLD